jgi:hypothetical protein
LGVALAVIGCIGSRVHPQPRELWLTFLVAALGIAVQICVWRHEAERPDDRGGG